MKIIKIVYSKRNWEEYLNIENAVTFYKSDMILNFKTEEETDENKDNILGWMKKNLSDPLFINFCFSGVEKNIRLIFSTKEGMDKSFSDILNFIQSDKILYDCIRCKSYES
ncbi:MAG: hypothetical protein WAT71_18025 [Ignavibacteria bacterium]